MSIYDLYYETQCKYSMIYGCDNCIVFMQIGDFYEAYWSNDLNVKNNVEGYNLDKLSILLNLKKASKDKKKEPSKENPSLIGFKTIYLSKYLRFLLNANFTVVIYDQVVKDTGNTKKKEFERVLSCIYNPETYIEKDCEVIEDKNKDNNIISLYIEEFNVFKKEKTIVSIGISMLNVSTNQNIVHETCGTETDYYYSLDETVRILKSYKPKAILLFYKTVLLTRNDIIKYLELNNYDKCYIVNKDDLKDDKMKLYNSDFFNINYQNNFLSKIYDEKNINKCLGKKMSIIEKLNLEDKPIAIISLIILLEYIKRHDNNLIKYITEPQSYIYQNHLILGNNAVEQLNVIDNSGLETYHKTFQSLYDVLNKTCTMMGKRFLKNSLLNPLSKNKRLEINKRYEYIEELINNNLHENIKLYLNKITDIEKLQRKMAVNSLHPKEFSILYQSYKTVIDLSFCINKNAILCDIINNEFIDLSIKFCKKYEQTFDDNKMSCSLNDIQESLHKKKIFPELDKLQFNVNEIKTFMDNVSKEISKIIKKYVPPMTKNKDDLVKVEYNKNDGYHIKMTLKRYELFEKNFNIIRFKLYENEYLLNWNNFIVKKNEKDKTIKVFIDYNDFDISNADENYMKLLTLSKLYYQKDVEDIYQNFKLLFNEAVNIIGFIDFLYSGAKCAIAYYYCKPIIKYLNNTDDDIGGFIKCKKIRHPIIERINEESEYIPNDLLIGNVEKNGKMQNGILIYGLNSAGKTSLMKAIGLSIIMAQIGYYVPAEKFIYEPYMSLYARITGYDNLFKGLSSFHLEMVELEAILKRTQIDGKNTLIIGDEVCRGTEIKSAMAIVGSTLNRLSKNETSFLFASHLHKLPELEMVKNINNMRYYHISVNYDRVKDCLIFDRKLTEGTGPDVYGITVAKYIIKDSDFIEDALKNMNEINEDLNETKIKKSKYNSKILMVKCELCDAKKDLNLHHINFQKDCDENGKINKKKHIHKNHMSNTIVLCENCHHNKVHNGKIIINGYLETMNGLKLKCHEV